MKLTYLIHDKNVDGTTNFAVFINPRNDDPTTEEPAFESEEEAKVALLESLRLKRLPGAFGDYVIQGYDPEGNAVEEISPEDREKAAADARQLVQQYPDIQMAFNTMIAARQTYGFGFTELERALAGVDKVGEESRPPHPLAVEILVQAATRAAGREFAADELYGRLGNNIFPWMAHAIKRNVVVDEKEKQADREELEKKRRATRIPIGIKTDPEDEELLDRTRPLVLIGYAPAVKFLLDHVVTTALSVRDSEHPDKLFTVIRFDGDDVNRENQDYLLRLKRSLWTNCARGKEKMGEFVANHVAQYMNKVPDLLVIDDLASTYTLGTIVGAGVGTGGYAPHRLAEAQKRLAIWYNHVGMGMVAGVPISKDKAIDCNSSELERLRTYCTVRPVYLIREAADLVNGLVRIQVGKNAWHVDVDEKLMTDGSSVGPVKKVITDV